MVLGTQNSLFWHSVSISSTSSFIRISYKHRRTPHFVFPVTYWLASQTLAFRSTAWSSCCKKTKYDLQDCQSYSSHAFVRENKTRQCDSRRVSRYVFLQGSLQRLDCMQGKGRNLCRNRPTTSFVDVYSWGHEKKWLAANTSFDVLLVRHRVCSWAASVSNGLSAPLVRAPADGCDGPPSVFRVYYNIRSRSRAACCSLCRPSSVQSFCVHVKLCAHPEHVVCIGLSQM